MRIELHTYLRSPTVLVQTGRLDVGTILSLTFCSGECLGALIVLRPLVGAGCPGLAWPQPGLGSVYIPPAPSALPNLLDSG